jgi:hypothetical protein
MYDAVEFVDFGKQPEAGVRHFGGFGRGFDFTSDLLARHV